MTFTVTKTLYYPKINEIPFKINNMNVLNVKIKNVKAYRHVADWKDGLELGVLFESYNTFLRTFNVGLDFGIQTPKTITKRRETGLDFGVLKLGNAGQIIGDIRFYDIVLNETNYDATLTPYGYGKWKIMITDDYIYKKALCKYSIQASLNADRPNTRSYLHKVDVPDVTDRGTVVLTTTNQPYSVEFSEDTTRFFHIVPELNVSLKAYSGTGTAPIIIPYNITRTGFDVAAKVDGAFVNCTITYAARGY